MDTHAKPQLDTTWRRVIEKLFDRCGAALESLSQLADELRNAEVL